MQIQVESIVEAHRPEQQVEALPQARVDPTRPWPYHLPAYNGLDCLWWSMLFRSMYWRDDSYFRLCAEWAGPVTKLLFEGTSVPAVQGSGFAELSDCVLVVIPGTSSELEALTYLVTHSLLLTTPDPTNEWRINSTWASRGRQVADRLAAWPPPSPRKPFIVVGHSSGGAYGAYVSFLIDTDIDKLTTLVTFGAPIWGTPSMRTRYLTHFTTGDRIQTGLLRPQVIEFGNPNDFVTTIPPSWALIDLCVPGYALANRPDYSRFTNLLELGNRGAPTPINQPTTLAAGTAALLALVTGGGLNINHSPTLYTAAAQLWADNDSYVTDQGFERERARLKEILHFMNVDGVGA